MKRISKRITALLIAVVMVLGATPIAGFVGLESPEINLCNVNAVSEEFTSGYYTYTVDENGYATITDCDESISGDVVIPPTLEGHPVTEIGYHAFEYCYNITSLETSNVLVRIGDGAFSFCSGIVNVVFGNNVTVIDVWAFSNCSALENVVFPENLESIGNRAFYNCVKLKNIELPYGLSCIGEYAFNNCDSLESISVPDSVKKVGEQAFAYCDNLTNVKLSKSISTLCNGVFMGCYNLTSVNVPKDVMGIEDFAVYDCGNLKSVSIGKNVTSIGYKAFYWCFSLKDVYYEGTEDEWNEITVDSHNDYLFNATIHFNSIIESDSSDSGQDDNNVEVEKAEHEIKFYAALPLLVLNNNSSVQAGVMLEKNGVVVEDDIEFSFAISNSDIISISDIQKENNGVMFWLNSKSEGKVKLTITECISGTIYSTNIQVDSGILAYNEACLPTYADEKFDLDGYINGMYIENVERKKATENGFFDVSFTVYNSSNLSGVVDVYDSYGKLYDSEFIDRFNGGYSSGIIDTICNFGTLLYEGIVSGELLTYRQDSAGEETQINIKVPEGGHIEITNNINYSDRCAILNTVQLVTATVLLATDDFKEVIGDIEEISKQTGKNVIEKMVNFANDEGRDDLINALAKKLTDLLKKLSLETITEGTLGAVLSSFVDEAQVILEDFDLELEKIVSESALQIGVSIGEEAFKKAAGASGVALSAMFKFNTFAEYTTFAIAILKQPDYKVFTIQFNDQNGNLVDSGVTIGTKEKETNLGASNFVMHSIIMSEIDLTEMMKEALDSVSPKYIVRNIFLERDGKISQPGQTVEVSIPIPDGFDINKSVIYWVKENGELISTDAWINGDYLVFETDHFSYYAVVETADSAGADNIAADIRTPSETTISYGDSIILHADLAETLPSGYYIKWTASNGNFDFVVSSDGTACKITPASSGDTTFTATVYDAEDNAVSYDEQEMTSKAGFFQKIIAFFKKLFGLTKTFEQVFRTPQ